MVSCVCVFLTGLLWGLNEMMCVCSAWNLINQWVVSIPDNFLVIENILKKKKKKKKPTVIVLYCIEKHTYNVCHLPLPCSLIFNEYEESLGLPCTMKVVKDIPRSMQYKKKKV